MKKEFWWINTNNMVEFDGPYKTKNEAIKAAERAYNRIEDICSSIAIAQTVMYGEIRRHQSRYKWRNA